MPISTVPNTPAHHAAGMETLLKSPQARARNRWIEERSPPAEAKQSHDLEDAPLISPTGSASPGSPGMPVVNPSTNVGRRRISICLALVICVVVVSFLKRESIMVSEWLGSWSRWRTGIPTDARGRLIFITATSPHALERGCQKHSAYRIHDERLVGLETVESITNSLLSRYQRKESTVACGPPPRSLSELDTAEFKTIVYLENGLNACFDDRFAGWARARGMEKDVEEAIDESCLKRRIATRRKYSCTIKEIGILRAAVIWRKLTDEAQARRRRLQLVDLVETSEPLLDEHAIQRQDALAHQILIRQLVEDHLRISSSSVDLSAFPEAPVGPVIDAGYCKVIKNVTTPSYFGAKASCLPSFIVFGAQKSGTDELSVWLNRNKFNRRMDGGVEIHFFDCLGRGRGEERFPCERKRSFQMNDHQMEVRESLLPNHTRTADPFDFSWIIERQKSPFIDDKLWTSYMRLGHLNHRDYWKEPSRTLVFEKSPSYLDMADPRDVVRLLPRGRFILLTRDPVQRLLSAYFQFCDNPDADEGECTMEEFSKYALAICGGTLDLETPGPHLKRRREFARAAYHGQYANYLENWTKYFWVDDDTMLDKQFLMVDHHHFRFTPLAVMYVIESFTGNRGPIRHYKYEPTFNNGYWTLGEYSKANHPSHKDSMPEYVQNALLKFYRPSILKLREMITRKNGPILYGCVAGETFFKEHTALHPDLFDGETRFSLPPWMKIA